MADTLPIKQRSNWKRVFGHRALGRRIPVPKRTSTPVTRNETERLSGDILVSARHLEPEPVSVGRTLTKPDPEAAQLPDSSAAERANSNTVQDVNRSPKTSTVPRVANVVNNAPSERLPHVANVANVDSPENLPRVANNNVLPFATRGKASDRKQKKKTATRGKSKPVLEAGKGSKGTWQFRLRWNSEPGRPVVYIATVTDDVYQLIREGDYDAYKEQTIASYEARAVSTRNTA